MLRARTFPLRAPSTPGGISAHDLAVVQRRHNGADYDTDWARRWPARMARAAIVEGPMRLGVKALASPRRCSCDRLGDVSGPVIFAANHHSHIDTPLLITSIPEPWRHKLVVAAAADYFFGTRVSSAVSSLMIGAIPIERSRVGRRSAERAAALIDEGWNLLIFPEGGRSPDGWGQPFRGGAAYLAMRCGVPVVPVHLSGTSRILRKGKTMPRAARTSVTFGDPITPHETENSSRFAARLEATVAALADEAHSDWYAARRRAYAGRTPKLTGPRTGAWRRAWQLDVGTRRRSRQQRWPNSY